MGNRPFQLGGSPSFSMRPWARDAFCWYCEKCALTYETHSTALCREYLCDRADHCEVDRALHLIQELLRLRELVVPDIALVAEVHHAGEGLVGHVAH